MPLSAFTPEMSESIEAQAKGYAITDKRLYLNFACSTPGLRTMKTELSKNDAAVCRICSNVKEPHLFCCPACWQRLPRELRAPFAVQKLRCLAWLREHERREHERLERIEAEYLRPPERGSW